MDAFKTVVIISSLCCCCFGQPPTSTTGAPNATASSAADGGPPVSTRMNELQRHFEFENVLSDTQQNYVVWRSEASNLKVLRLEDETRSYRIEFLLCIEPFKFGDTVRFVLDDIQYANDGPSDLVFVEFDGAPFASFITHEQWRSGHEWNVFKNNQTIGFPMDLDRGTHSLQISTITDQWGVEFDRIRINVENQDPTKDLFCGASLSTV